MGPRVEPLLKRIVWFLLLFRNGMEQRTRSEVTMILIWKCRREGRMSASREWYVTPVGYPKSSKYTSPCLPVLSCAKRRDSCWLLVKITSTSSAKWVSDETILVLLNVWSAAFPNSDACFAVSLATKTTDLFWVQFRMHLCDWLWQVGMHYMVKKSCLWVLLPL